MILNRNLSFVIVLLILSLFSSCGGEKEEVLDITDVIPGSENYKDEVKIDTAAFIADTLSKYLDVNLVPELKLIDSKFSPITSTMLPERFAAKSFFKIAIQTSNDSITICQWKYKDSIKTMNAFYNWLDCFGKNCKSLRYREAGKFQKEAMLIFVNDTSITYLSSNRMISPDLWIKYFEKNNKILEWDNIVLQQRGMKSVWGNSNKLTKRFIPLPEEKKETTPNEITR